MTRTLITFDNGLNWIDPDQITCLTKRGESTVIHYNRTSILAAQPIDHVAKKARIALVNAADLQDAPDSGLISRERLREPAPEPSPEPSPES